jgi:hypothetical protein
MTNTADCGCRFIQPASACTQSQWCSSTRLAGGGCRAGNESSFRIGRSQVAVKSYRRQIAHNIRQYHFNEISSYDAVRKAIAPAHYVDEVKQPRDKAKTVHGYAQQAGDFELQNKAAEIRLFAEPPAGGKCAPKNQLLRCLFDLRDSDSES